eukprot:GILI01007275.1.p1 GENE.GILI01007275.1~~GILI01007275.1.p1  ORF type:complete len:571 (+),score=174.72 GILI01007275.1:60-1772(+)
MRLKLGTFNIRNTTDRYPERREWLKKALQGLGVDLLGLQEVAFGQDGQLDHLVEGSDYDAFPARSRYPYKAYAGVADPSFRIDGNAVLMRSTLGLVPERHDSIYLSPVRVAQRLLVTLPNKKKLWFVNTHLHHMALPQDVALRMEQVSKLLAWMQPAQQEADVVVITGDFNAPPTESTYALVQQHGFQSAYLTANGKEPETTFPSGLQAPTMDTDPPDCLDYIWIKGEGVRVLSAHLDADKPLPTDSTIYPSDHIAVCTEVEIPDSFCPAELSSRAGMAGDDHSFNPVVFSRQLTTQVLGRDLLYTPVIDSTQTLLKALPPSEEDGGRKGLIAVADVQQSGHGRGSNTWESPKGALMCSFKLQLPSSLGKLLPFVQYVVSLALVHSVNKDGSLYSAAKLRIKWPNDIYVISPEEQPVKVGGVLCQSSLVGAIFDVTVGVGINVNNRHPTLCMRDLVRSGLPNAPLSRENILAGFLNTLEPMLQEMIEAQSFAPLQALYVQYWLHSEQKLVVKEESGQGDVNVVVKGLSANGYLLAQETGDGAGERQTFELHPDGNSLDFMQGLIKKKLSK